MTAAFMTALFVGVGLLVAVVTVLLLAQPRLATSGVGDATGVDSGTGTNSPTHTTRS